jgi:ADP-heptose:LPS heptosyltransferase
VAEYGIAADPTRLEIDPPAGVQAPAGGHGATLLHPGAASPARRWPADRWAEVARAEAGAGRPVVITGGPDEVALASDVAARAGLPDSAVLAGGTSVLQLAAIVAAAGRVVCGDTGVAHLATALGRPSVVLFGPVSPELWGPPPGRPQHIALWTGRTGDPHARTVDPGLLEISASDVIDALDRQRRRNAGQVYLPMSCTRW